jgi:hypothetical protein
VATASWAARASPIRARSLRRKLGTRTAFIKVDGTLCVPNARSHQVALIAQVWSRCRTPPT